MGILMLIFLLPDSNKGSNFRRARMPIVRSQSQSQLQRCLDFPKKKKPTTRSRRSTKVLQVDDGENSPEKLHKVPAAPSPVKEAVSPRKRIQRGESGAFVLTARGLGLSAVVQWCSNKEIKSKSIAMLKQ